MSFGEMLAHVKSLIVAADRFQQVNFLMIVLVWIGQFLKYFYDYYRPSIMLNDRALIFHL